MLCCIVFCVLLLVFDIFFLLLLLHVLVSLDDVANESVRCIIYPHFCPLPTSFRAFYSSLAYLFVHHSRISMRYLTKLGKLLFAAVSVVVGIEHRFVSTTEASAKKKVFNLFGAWNVFYQFR